MATKTTMLNTGAAKVRYDLVKKLIDGLEKGNINLESTLYNHMANIKKWIDDKAYNPKDKSLDSAINQLIYGIEVNRSIILPTRLRKTFTEVRDMLTSTDEKFADWIKKAHTPEVQAFELQRRRGLSM